MSSSRTSRSSTWSEIVGGDLQPDRRAEPAPGQLPLQGLQQVLVAVLVDLELGVAGDPEQVVLDDLHAGEELPEVGGDQLLDRQEPDAGRRRRPAVAPRTKRGTLLGTLTRANSSGPPSGSRTDDGEVQRQAGDVREGVRRVDRQRGQHREDLLAEVGAQPLPLGGSRSTQRSSWMSSAASAGWTSSAKQAACRATSSAVRSAISSSCSRGGRPSGRRAPAGRSAAGASGRRPGPCRTRPGCWRRWPGTWPAPAAGSPGPRPGPAPGR